MNSPLSTPEQAVDLRREALEAAFRDPAKDYFIDRGEDVRRAG